MKHLPELRPCPYCGCRPDIDRCAPWPCECGPAPWYVGCYQPGDREHFIGVNADTQRDAMLDWNTAVEREEEAKEKADVTNR